MNAKVLKIVVTDSGLGGLDVAARFYEWILKQEPVPDIDLKFVNALPETRHGYNRMANRERQVRVFDSVLW